LGRHKAGRSLIFAAKRLLNLNGMVAQTNSSVPVDEAGGLADDGFVPG
jgi:hypothetical protein